MVSESGQDFSTIPDDKLLELFMEQDTNLNDHLLLSPGIADRLSAWLQNEHNFQPEMADFLTKRVLESAFHNSPLAPGEGRRFNAKGAMSILFENGENYIGEHPRNISRRDALIAIGGLASIAAAIGGCVWAISQTVSDPRSTGGGKGPTRTWWQRLLQKERA